jgi:hypothetical protein
MSEDEDVAKPVRSVAAQLLFMTDFIITCSICSMNCCMRGASLPCLPCLYLRRQLALLGRVNRLFHQQPICAHPGGRAQTWKDVTNESIGPFNEAGKPHGQVRTLLSVGLYSRSPEESGEHPYSAETALYRVCRAL